MTAPSARTFKAALVCAISVAIVTGGLGAASADSSRAPKADAPTGAFVASKFRSDRKVAPTEVQKACLTKAAKSWAKSSVKKGSWTANPSSKVKRSCDLTSVKAVRFSGKGSKAKVVATMRKTSAYKSSVRSARYSLYGAGAFYDKKSKTKKVVLLVAHSKAKPTSIASPPVAPIPSVIRPPAPAPSSSPSSPTPTPTPSVPVVTPAPTPTVAPSTPEPTPSSPTPTVPVVTPAPTPTVSPSTTTPTVAPEPVYTAPVRQSAIEQSIKEELVTQMGDPGRVGAERFEVVGGNDCLDETVTNWGLATGSDKNKDKTFVPNSFFNNTVCQYEFTMGMVIRSDKSNARDIVAEWLTAGEYTDSEQVTSRGFGAFSPFASFLHDGYGRIAVSTYTDFRGKTWTYLMAASGVDLLPARLTPTQITVLNDEMHRLLNVYRTENGKPALPRSKCLDDFAEGARTKSGSFMVVGWWWAIASELKHRNILAPCPAGNAGEVMTSMSLYDYRPTDEYALGLAVRAMNNFKSSSAHNRMLLSDSAAENGVASYHPDNGGSIYVVMEPSDWYPY